LGTVKAGRVKPGRRFLGRLLGGYDEAEDCGDRHCDQAGTQEGFLAGGQVHENSFGNGIRDTTAYKMGQLESGLRSQCTKENRQQLLTQPYLLLGKPSYGQVIPANCKIILTDAASVLTPLVAAGSTRLRLVPLVCEVPMAPVACVFWLACARRTDICHPFERVIVAHQPACRVKDALYVAEHPTQSVLGQ
jgi:hypothetical protein